MEENEIGLPGKALATRPLHLIFIADCSGSMSLKGKIQALNTAIHEVVPHMRSAADENANARLLIRALKFSSGAQWHIAQPTPVDEFRWVNLTANGVTDMGKALSMVADQLKVPPMESRALPPVLVLLSDGQPTDNFEGGLKQLMEQPWGKKAVRVAIAIGEDADLDALTKFTGNVELPPLRANNPEALVNYIRWVSTQVVKEASAPSTRRVRDPGQSPSTPGGGIDIPAPPPVNADDVW